jgi:hypothetical protein
MAAAAASPAGKKRNFKLTFVPFQVPKASLAGGFRNGKSGIGKPENMMKAAGPEPGGLRRPRLEKRRELPGLRETRRVR